MSKTRDIDIQVLIERPIESVFDAWIKPALLEKWLARKANVEPVVGGIYELFWDLKNLDQDSTVGCHILDLVPNAELCFTWKGPRQHAEIMGEKTKVFVRLEPRDGATLLRFVHTGWGSGARWDEARRWQASAWKEALLNLKNMLENTDKFLQHISMN